MTFSARPSTLLCAVSLSTLSACATIPQATSAPESAATIPANTTPVTILAPALPDSVTTQLPRNAVPTHYSIEITPDAAAATFNGSVKTRLDILTPSDSVTMNAADLAIEGATLTDASGAQIPVTVTTDADKQTATFAFGKTVAPGHYELSARYAGKIYDQANGLFHLDYKDPKGADKRALFTQFEAPDARRFAPMWDEPSYKATFDLTANVPADQMAVGNMPIASSTATGNGKKRVTFQTTPKMSSYLLFFGLGEFGRINQQVGNTDVGIIMGKGNEEKARFALKSATELLPYYNAYFGVDYPLPKLDNIAGPGQSQFFSAMENWGAIFSFERILLDDPKVTTEAGRQAIYAVNGHEMAHQWFGDLVTMSWWDDLWLNEGFASWMETKATAHFNPDWQVELGRVGGRESAMGLDALQTTHPVVQKIQTVEQTSQAFDSITYSKGEAVITMLENYAGEDVWRTGIRAYMKQHAYGNTVTNDLWSAVEKAGAKGLVAIANDFTQKPGIPLIKLTGARCAGGQTILQFQQGEYSRDRKGAAPLSWNVPVVAHTVGAAPARTIVTNGTGSVTLAGCGTALVNAGQAGYYRTLYTAPMLAALTRDFAKLDPIDQLGLLADQYALASGDYQGYAAALDLRNAVPANANSKVIAAAASSYGGNYDLFKGNAKVQAKIARMADARFAPVLARLGMKPKAGEPANDAILRNQLVSLLGSMGNAGVLAEAKRLFASLDTNPAALDGPMRTTWLGLIADKADKATWDKLHALAKAETNKQARSSLYSLLASPADAALAKAALDLAMTSEPGPTDSPAMISRVSYNHPELALDFALANTAEVEQMVDVSSRSRYVARLASGSSKPETMAKLEAYAGQYLTAASRKPVDQALSSIKSRIETEARSKPQIEAWYMARGRK